MLSDLDPPMQSRASILFYLFSFIFLCALLLPGVWGTADVSAPSQTISNWKDTLAVWRTSRNAAAEKPSRPVGLDDLRIDPSWSQSSLSTHSFGLILNDNVLASPELWETATSISPDHGGLVSVVTAYNGSALPLGVNVVQTYLFPPNQPYYLVIYDITAATSSDASSPVNVALLDYQVTAPANDDPSPNPGVYAFHDPSTSYLMCDMTKIGAGYSAMYPWSLDGESSFSYSAGNGAQTIPDTLQQFEGNRQHQLDNATAWQGDIASMGIAVTFHFDSASSSSSVKQKQKQIAFIHTVRGSYAEAVAAIQTARSAGSVNAVISGAKAAWQDWKVSGTQPQQVETSAQLQVYWTGLFALKHGQHPVLGTILSSTGALYGMKTWSRDGAFAAMILDAAGYHAEAAAYWTWILSPTTALDPSTTVLYTCYDWWSGGARSFVTPELDSIPAVVLGVHWHCYLQPESASCLSLAKNERLWKFADFLLSQRERQFFLPDYSIWEESSSPSSGQPLPTSVTTFTQALAVGALQSAGYLTAFLNGATTDTTTTTLASASSASASSYHQAAALLNATLHNGNSEGLSIYNAATGSYRRGIWANSTEGEWSEDDRLDASTAMAILLLSGSQEAGTNALLHLYEMLGRGQAGGCGVARYQGDIFYYASIFDPAGQEVSQPMPPWGVTTMFAYWASIALNTNANSNSKEVEVDPRLHPYTSCALEWMADIAAYGGMPVGEAVDVTGKMVWSSAMDLYESAGVFIWGVLQHSGQSPPFQPKRWTLP